jgi:hypothetical protein
MDSASKGGPGAKLVDLVFGVLPMAVTFVLPKIAAATAGWVGMGLIVLVAAAVGASKWVDARRAKTGSASIAKSVNDAVRAGATQEALEAHRKIESAKLDDREKAIQDPGAMMKGLGVGPDQMGPLMEQNQKEKKEIAEARAKLNKMTLDEFRKQDALTNLEDLTLDQLMQSTAGMMPEDEARRVNLL